MSGESLTTRVVAELAPQLPALSCCRSALIEGMRLSSGPDLSLARLTAARVALHALHSNGVAASVERDVTPRRPHYRVVIDTAQRVPAPSDRACCARSRLYGAFVAGGRVNQPDAAPHLEIDAVDQRAAGRLLADAARLHVAMQTTKRRSRHLLLARSSESVAVLLSLLGAQSARLEFEEGRVVREVRNDVNRKLNAETANLKRTVAAAVAQVDAIRRLKQASDAWEALPEKLREAGDVRLRLPGEPLERLALEAGCSRSAMAARLRRLVEAAA